MTDTMFADSTQVATAIENSGSSQTNGSTEKNKHSSQNVPRLPRELTPFAPFVSVIEHDQRGPLFKGPGSKHDTGKYKVRPADDETVKRAKKFAMEQSVKFVLMKQQQQQQRAQLDIIKKQQALLLMCRIYVGSINFELNEVMLKQAFQPFGPVKAVSLTFDPVTNRHKGFAFLEYELPEAAQLAMEQMNGVVLGGRNIKVGRPSNMPQAQPIIDQLTEEAKNYNRIYIASIHPDLSENDIRSVFEAFGKIKSCTLSKDTGTNKHKGYGFIEYESIQAAQDAISSMNLFDLGGQHLRVGKAITPPEGLSAAAPGGAAAMPQATAMAVANITAQLQAKEAEINPTTPVIPTQLIPNPLAPVNYFSGTMAPTTVAAALSVASYSGATSVTSMISSIMNPTGTIPTNSVQPAAALVHAVGTRAGFSVAPSANIPTQATITPGLIPPPQMIIPPVPSSVIPQPTILEEPPIPVGLKNELESSKTQQYPSISLVLPKAGSSTKSDTTEALKTGASLSNVDDASATLSQQEELSVKGREQRHLLMQKLNQRRLDSRVCILRNMVGADDVDGDLEQEITEECSKYGDVVKVVIYTEQQGEDESAEQIVKIFVEFQTSKQAETTVNSLNDRWFGGRKISAELYDQAAYEAEDLSG